MDQPLELLELLARQHEAILVGELVRPAPRDRPDQVAAVYVPERGADLPGDPLWPTARAIWGSTSAASQSRIRSPVGWRVSIETLCSPISDSSIMEDVRPSEDSSSSRTNRLACADAERAMEQTIGPVDALLSSPSVLPPSLFFGFVMIRTRNVLAPVVLHGFMDWQVTLNG